ncbi:hypothetical protein WIV_gp140 [Wiseana iridescent virus]|uniref:Uncharacterized protein n=1 Tax=Wiseana iridescent virus TaxID=68347 RepID=G0T5G6_IRV9|nr:hypothetical protein WIV_gp140 [Wiseana iridescent virus]ADO00484.1 hypothetical protein [Wiseana iridescent virus]
MKSEPSRWCNAPSSSIGLRPMRFKAGIGPRLRRLVHSTIRSKGLSVRYGFKKKLIRPN